LLDVMSTLVRDPFHDMPGFFGMSMRELIAVIRPGAWVAFERGELTEQEFLNRFFADGRAYDQRGFLETVRAGYRWLPGMQALTDELKATGHHLVAMSNYPIWYRHVAATHGLEQLLDGRFVSYLTGARKPEAAAYLGPCRALGRPPEQCVFVDDRRDNCDAAAALGMVALRFTAAETLRQDLARHGVLLTARGEVHL